MVNRNVIFFKNYLLLAITLSYLLLRLVTTYQMTYKMSEQRRTYLPYASWTMWLDYLAKSWRAILIAT